MRSLTVPRLSPRDQAVIQTVHLLGQVSAGQLLRLHFADGSPATRGTRMRRTMTRLSEHGLVDQLPTRWIGGHGGGSGGYLYQAQGSRSRTYREHRLAIAELYVRIVEAERAGQFRLVEFACEPGSYRRIGTLELKPDAALRLSRGEARRHVFIELDRATETAAQITSKLTTYAAAERSWPTGSAFPLVLFVVSHELASGEQRQIERIVGAISRHPAAELFAVCPFDGAIDHLVR